MLVVSIAGSSSVRSRSGMLLEHAGDWLSRRGAKVTSHQVLDSPVEDLLHARLDSPPVLALAEQIGRTDDLLVVTPVYKTLFSGALKVLFDLLSERALEHRVVLPFATSGSNAHMLAVDYALESVLAALKTQEVPYGVFAVDKQTAYAAESGPAHLEPALEQRLEDAPETFHLALSRRPQPINPQLLNERLANVR